MTSIEIRGIKVTFPYKPYDIQKDYMSKVIESLQNSTNAVLESPTGTGKTLSLLCSSLAWLMTEKIKNAAAYKHAAAYPPDSYNPEGGGIDDILQNVMSMRPPKIIYSSRTHSQLGQAVQELKNTIYKDCIKSSILGSREQLCLKKEVLEERSQSLQVNVCRSLVKSHGCSLYHGVDKNKDTLLPGMSILDIEDLVGMGRKYHFCPYYMARQLKQSADILFMPYNYLLDPNSRKNFGLELYNSIIILDEAHNVEHTCEESASVQITSTDIAMAIDELTVIMKAMENDFTMLEDDASKDFTLEDLVVLKTILLKFEKVIDEIEIKAPDGDTYDGQYLQRLIEQTGIEANNRANVVNVLDKLVQYMTATRNEAFNRNGQHLQRLKDLLVMIFENDSEELREKIKKCFRVFIREETVNKGRTSWKNKSKTKMQTVINYWCFSPGFGMDALMKLGVRNVILTSGTLAPLKPLISELGLSVPVRLENPHIVSKSQLLVKIVSNGFRNIKLDSSFKNRTNNEYIDSLGKTIRSFANMIPDGLLVFFPSYPILESCSKTWEISGVWNEISKVKPIFTEPRNKDQFKETISNYYAQIKQQGSRGACFFAVCRGKVSEGLDFADENGRGVIITGLPFPPLKDPRVILKKQYLDILSTQQNEVPNGQKWYTLEAVRAVNQAIGRVIRHKNDYGAILLCDHRFDNPNLKSDLSTWLREYIQTTNTFAQAIAGVTKFFHEANIKFPSKNNKMMVENNSSSGNMTYMANETAFGSVCSDETRKILHPTVITEASILDDYKSNTSIEPSQKRDTFSVLDIDNTKLSSSSFHFKLQDYKCPEQKVFEPNHEKRNTDLSVSELNPQKKRKITIVPNNVKYGSSTNVSQQKLNENALNIVQKIAKNMKPDKIQLFHTIILAYKKDNEIFSFIKGLHELLTNESNSEYYLCDINAFIKEKDKQIFESYIRLRSKWDLLTQDERNKSLYSDFLLTPNNV